MRDISFFLFHFNWEMNRIYDDDDDETHKCNQV